MLKILLQLKPESSPVKFAYKEAPSSRPPAKKQTRETVSDQFAKNVTSGSHSATLQPRIQTGKQPHEQAARKRLLKSESPPVPNPGTSQATSSRQQVMSVRPTDTTFAQRNWI